MNAKICDRCSVLWKDDGEDEFSIRTIYLNQGESHSDKLGSYDLCNPCEIGLWEYFKNLDKEERK